MCVCDEGGGSRENDDKPEWLLPLIVLFQTLGLFMFGKDREFFYF